MKTQLEENNPKKSPVQKSQSELDKKLQNSREQSARETKQRGEIQEVKRTPDGTREESVEEQAP